MRFKPGDRFVRSPKCTWRPGVRGTIISDPETRSAVTGVFYIVLVDNEVDNRHTEFAAKYLIPEEVFDSPLYKVLNES